jgi:membrane peptidoglycan carboxypeptidase
MYRRMGFGEPTGLESPAESTGMFKPPSRWSGFSAASLCIGQEIAITGIQLANAYCAIANGGNLMQPRLVRKIVSQAGETVEEFEPIVKRRVLEPGIARWLRQMLLGVVEGGTGQLAAMADYTAGGKTSTAQKANPRGGYFMEKVVTSFVGIAPMSDPRIVLYVAVNEPKGDEKTLYGGKVAAPYWAVIMDRVLKHLKVPPDKKPALAIAPVVERALASSTSPMAAKSSGLFPGRPSLQTAIVPLLPESCSVTGPGSGFMTTGSSSTSLFPPILPDFRGKTLREVACRARDMNLQAMFEGNGIAIAQEPLPGTPIDTSKIILVRFSALDRR